MPRAAYRWQPHEPVSLELAPPLFLLPASRAPPSRAPAAPASTKAPALPPDVPSAPPLSCAPPEPPEPPSPGTVDEPSLRPMPASSAPASGAGMQVPPSHTSPGAHPSSIVHPCEQVFVLSPHANG